MVRRLLWRRPSSPGEPIVTKHRYSAFYNTDLDTILRANGIRTGTDRSGNQRLCGDSAREAFVQGLLRRGGEGRHGRLFASGSRDDRSEIDRFFGEVTSIAELKRVAGAKPAERAPLGCGRMTGSEARSATECGSNSTLRSKRTMGLVLRADVYRPASRWPIPSHHQLRPVCEGHVVPRESSVCMEALGRRLSGGDTGSSGRYQAGRLSTPKNGYRTDMPLSA